MGAGYEYAYDYCPKCCNYYEVICRVCDKAEVQNIDHVLELIKDFNAKEYLKGKTKDDATHGQCRDSINRAWANLIG